MEKEMLKLSPEEALEKAKQEPVEVVFTMQWLRLLFEDAARLTPSGESCLQDFRASVGNNVLKVHATYTAPDATVFSIDGQARNGVDGALVDRRGLLVTPTSLYRELVKTLGSSNFVHFLKTTIQEALENRVIVKGLWLENGKLAAFLKSNESSPPMEEWGFP